MGKFINPVVGPDCWAMLKRGNFASKNFLGILGSFYRHWATFFSNHLDTLPKLDILQGGETENTPSSADVKFYDLEKSEWAAKPDMLVKRKDHACAFVTLGEEKGILVSGGVNEDDQLLDSVEFYSIDKDEWKEVAHLKQARTEHGKQPCQSRAHPFDATVCSIWIRSLYICLI